MSDAARAGERASGLQAFHALTRSREPVIVAAMAIDPTFTLSARDAAAAPTSPRRMATLVDMWRVEAAS